MRHLASAVNRHREGRPHRAAQPATRAERLGDSPDDHASCRSRPLFLASVPAGDNSQYSKRVSWVDSERLVVVKTEFFGKRGQQVKEYRVEQLEEIDGIWTATRTVMVDLKLDHTTTMALTDVQYNVPVEDSVFSVYNLD